MPERFVSSEIYMNTEQIEVAKVTELSFARGKVGLDERLAGPAAEAEFAQGLAAHTAEITKPNTADCGDDRETIRLADGTADPGLLRVRIVPQLFGGLGLATTKALTAANAAFIKDAKTFWEAYEKVSNTLVDMGEEDGGHENCGASLSVESSVANPIEAPTLLSAANGLIPPNERTERLLTANAAHKQDLLQAGFYSDWDSQKHADYLSARFPQNFSYLAVDPEHRAGGHHGAGVYVIDRPNVGFAKNGMIQDTGQEAFCVTLPKMRQIANMLGGSDEERQAILLGFADDTLHVGGGIVVEGMPVFAETSLD
jgi:hypothetical protein